MDEQTQELIGVVRSVGAPALFEQLAEECVELAEAALKQAKALRNENPFPADPVEIARAIDEEVTDMCLCFDVLGLTPNQTVASAKLVRWAGRIAANDDTNSNPEDIPEPSLVEPNNPDERDTDD